MIIVNKKHELMDLKPKPGNEHKTPKIPKVAIRYIAFLYVIFHLLIIQIFLKYLPQQDTGSLSFLHLIFNLI